VNRAVGDAGQEFCGDAPETVKGRRGIPVEPGEACKARKREKHFDSVSSSSAETASTAENTTTTGTKTQRNDMGPAGKQKQEIEDGTGIESTCRQQDSNW
jgi:hypothetical protein